MTSTDMNSRIDVERQIVERYQRMADASGRMLDAARADQWDTVCAIEAECAALIAELSTMGDLAPTDPQLRQQKVGLMRRVLADDAQIRLLSQPWLRKLDALMNRPEADSLDAVARLERAYGTGTFTR
jgi:flagellar protein FliT